MPTIHQTCHELRIRDENRTWRIVYALERDAVVILEVFPKKTEKTPDSVITACKRRLKQYRST
jgi:phage-related protein